MGHEGAVTGLCLLPGPAQLVASTDSAGACHLWSAATGALAACFTEPGTAAGPGAALLPGNRARTAAARGAAAAAGFHASICRFFVCPACKCVQAGG